MKRVNFSFKISHFARFLRFYRAILSVFLVDSIDFQLHKLNLCHRALEHLEMELSDVDDLVEFGETLVFVQDESANGHVVVALGQVKVEALVDFLDFHSSRELIARFVDLPCSEAVAVVFVFDFAKYFLYQVFKGDHSAGAAKLIDNDGDMDFILLEIAQEVVNLLCLRHEIRRTDK